MTTYVIVEALFPESVLSFTLLELTVSLLFSVVTSVEITREAGFLDALLLEGGKSWKWRERKLTESIFSYGIQY